MIGTNKHMLTVQKLTPLREYRDIIQHLNNETMLQTLAVMMPNFKDELYNIKKRCYFVAVAMGLLVDTIYTD